MTVNFDTDLFNETMGLNTVKLSYYGAYPKDIDNIMKLVVESPNKISHVFLGYIFAPQIQQENTPLNEIYWTWPYMIYGTEWVISNYEQPAIFEEPLPEDSYRDNIEENLRKY